MGEESTVPGSDTVTRRRWATFAAVIPVESELASERCGFNPNSGQSRRRELAACAVAGIALVGAVGAEKSAGALPPHALNRAQPINVAAIRGGWADGISKTVTETRRSAGYPDATRNQLARSGHGKDTECG
jgi:hypothetical protein